ncbi:hypothetical protein [Pseudonocardia sp. 73-21]|uniref:hypothetical protein n=1 Tax=Pseudonocardia sp. 73-21 TaxID=1895809 RepID=UPI00260A28CC|nr:hypothetical protein [Pseudonocardia sp. 73-21]
MSYSIDIDPVAQDTISALPPAALLSLAEALAMLELTPWSGRSVNPNVTPTPRSAICLSAPAACSPT